MIYKNAELFNVEEIIDNGDGSISWLRVPHPVYDKLEIENGKRVAKSATGVEIRFVIKSGDVKIKMSTYEGDGIFHVYRGGIQGGWQDHEVHKTVSGTVDEYVITKAENSDKLKAVTEKCGYDWDSDVVRIIFDRGYFKIYDIEGDIEPPQKNQVPKKTIFSYGSSITHGSNSMDMSHAWASILAHNLNADVRNLGMAGSCAMEPEMIDYIAAEGERGNWDIAIMELGINVLTWEESKIYERVENAIKQVAGRNKDKKVYIISPFYCEYDFDGRPEPNRWRSIIKEIADKLSFENVTLINGLDMLGDVSLLSADMVHPNIYGVQQIADRMTRLLKI